MTHTHQQGTLSCGPDSFVKTHQVTCEDVACTHIQALLSQRYVQDGKDPRTGKELLVQCSFIRADGRAWLNHEQLMQTVCDTAVRGGPHSVGTARVHTCETSPPLSAGQDSIATGKVK